MEMIHTNAGDMTAEELKDALALQEEAILKKLRPMHKMQGIIFKLQMLFGVLVALVMLPGAIMIDSIDNDVLEYIILGVGVVSIVGFALAWICQSINGSKYDKAYREAFLPILPLVMPDVVHSPDRGISKDEFKEIGIANWHGSYEYSSEDLIEGTYNGVKFRQADIYIKESDTKTVFADVDGVLREFDYNIGIEGRILITDAMANLDRPEGLERVMMEDVEFNDKFYVYADDPHSVFYLLTPHFMDYLKPLEEMATDIYFFFNGEKLYFLESGNGGLFSAPKFSDLDVRAEIERTQNMLLEVRTLIDVLQVDRK